MNWKFIEAFKTEPPLNTADYQVWVITIFFIGCMWWLVAYGALYYDAVKYKRIGYSFAAQACAFGWEIWFGLGIVRVTDMGWILQLAYFMWFFFDCFLLYKVWTMGDQQMDTPAGKKSFRMQYAIQLALWIALWPFFMIQYDDPVGAYSGYTCNVFISAAFLFQKLKQPNFGTNRIEAVTKFLGTAFCSVVVWTHFMSNHLLVVEVILFACLDIIFMYLVFTGPTTKEAAEAEAIKTAPASA